MFSVSTTNSRYSQPFGKGYAPQVTKGFTVRVLKGPAFTSFPYVASNKFEQTTRAAPLSEPRQSQNWYSSRSNSTSPSELPKSSRPQTSSRTTTSTSQGSLYEPNARSTAPGYNIYHSSKDTYIYEPSLSSKSDQYSTSEFDDASTATYTPSSAFSPAMSTDSITTVRGPITPDASSTDLRSSNLASSVSSNSVHMPRLAQAQSALRGIFWGQTPHEGQPTRGQPPHAPHATSRLASPGSSDAGRSTTPIRLSATSSGSVSRTTHDPYSATASSEPSQPHQPPSRVHSPSSESEHSELDRLARVNAHYNAASSASSSAYYSARESILIPNSTANVRNEVDSGTQLFPELPLRNSPPERVHVQSSVPYMGARNHEQPSSYLSATDAAHNTPENGDPQTPSYRYAARNSEGTLPNESESFVSPSTDRTESQVPRQPPARRQSEELSPSHIPQVRNDGPSSRYVPASRTMLPNNQPATRGVSSEPTVTTSTNDDPRINIPSVNPQRERRTSLSQAHAPPNLSLPQNSPERSHPPPGISMTQHDQPRRDSAAQQPISHTYINSDSEHLLRSEHLSPTAAPVRPPSIYPASQMGPDQIYQSPQSSHPVIPEAQNYASPHSSATRTSHYIASNTGRQPKVAPSNSQPLTPPEETRRHPSTYHIIPQPQDRSSATSSEGIGPVYPGAISAAQANVVFPKNRRNSIITPLHISPTLSTVPNPVPVMVPNAPVQHVQSNPPQAQRSTRIYGETRNLHQDIHRSNHHGQQDPGYKLQESQHRANTSPVNHNSHEASERSTVVLPSIHQPLSPNLSMPQRHPVPSQDAPTRTRSNSLRRFSDYLPNHQPFAVPSVSSDPGPGNDYRSPPLTDPHRRGEGSASYLRNIPAMGTFTQGPASFFTSAAPRSPTTVLPADTARSRTPFVDVRLPPAESQRRNSDGDQSIANGSVYPPGHLVYTTSNAPTSTSSAPAEPQPQRRYSDGDQVNTSDRRSVALFRTVRWNENLVCPSPIFPHQRRKGWFNRRGDQLWTNEGAYKPPTAGQEYPPDLDDYPEHGDGWMNEECTRIDMGHRLVPKAPLKSALKQPRALNT